MKTISYGKERPVCTDENEDCYQRNRHAHFAARSMEPFRMARILFSMYPSI